MLLNEVSFETTLYFSLKFFTHNFGSFAEDDIIRFADVLTQSMEIAQ